MIRTCLGFDMLSSQVLLLAEAAHEQSPPIIDFDGTILLQFVAFLVMYLVLKHLVFRPYVALRHLRASATEGVEHEASSLAAQAKALSSQYESALSALKADIEKERLSLYNESQMLAQEQLRTARQELETAASQATSQLIAEAQIAKEAILAQSSALGASIASKILGQGGQG